MQDLKDNKYPELGWKYDPKKFARNGMVDPVSLYMTFVDNMDERIEGALEELLEEYKW